MKRNFLNYIVIAVVVAVMFIAVVYVIDLIFGKVETQPVTERVGEGLLFGIAMSAYYYIEDRFFKKKRN